MGMVRTGSPEKPVIVVSEPEGEEVDEDVREDEEDDGAAGKSG